jgi:hypothetical protein
MGSSKSEFRSARSLFKWKPAQHTRDCSRFSGPTRVSIRESNRLIISSSHSEDRLTISNPWTGSPSDAALENGTNECRRRVQNGRYGDCQLESSIVAQGKVGGCRRTSVLRLNRQRPSVGTWHSRFISKYQAERAKVIIAPAMVTMGRPVRHMRPTGSAILNR